MLQPVAIAALGLVLAGPAKPGLEVVPADLKSILAAVRKPGAEAVLVNVWATWCEPCREEMPELLRFFRDHEARGLRLVLVSTDDPEDKAEVTKFLASHGVDFASYVHTGANNQAFIDGIDPKWTGTLPASLLYDARGERRRLWSGPVTYQALAEELARLSKQNPKVTKEKPKDKPRRKP